MDLGNAAWLAGMLVILLSCACAQVLASESDDTKAALARLDTLARHQPAQAQIELKALQDRLVAPDEGTALHIALIQAHMADVQYRSNDVLRIYDAIHDRLVSLGDPRQLADMEHLRAAAFYELGRNEEGWQAVEAEARQAEKSGDDDLIAMALTNRSRYLMLKGNYAAAAQAIADAEHQGHSPQVAAEVDFAAALIARNIEEWELTLQECLDARDKFEEIGDLTGVADALAGAGEAYFKLGRLSEAVEPLDAAGRIYEQVDDQVGAAGSELFLALVQFGKKDLKSALRLNAKAIARLSKADEPWRLAKARVDRAAFLLEAGNTEKAFEMLELARPVVTAKGNPTAQVALHDVTARVLSVVGRYQEANREILQARDIETMRTNQMRVRQLAVQRGRLESERLKQENNLLKVESDSNQRALSEALRAARYQRFALGLAVAIFLGGIWAFWQQRKLTKRVEKIAEVDELTGVRNRRNLLRVGQRVVDRCVKNRRPCAVFMLDIDRFKQINDRFGHQAGDQVLRAVSDSLSRCLRPGDLIGRYGGEEFLVILPEADAEKSTVIAERLRVNVEKLRPEWATLEDGLTISGGIVNADGTTGDLAELIARADKALYRAKNLGRNRMEFDQVPSAAVVG